MVHAKSWTSSLKNLKIFAVNENLFVFRVFKHKNYINANFSMIINSVQ